MLIFGNIPDTILKIITEKSTWVKDISLQNDSGFLLLSSAHLIGEE